MKATNGYPLLVQDVLNVKAATMMADLRMLRRQTMDANSNLFSQWCWNGECRWYGEADCQVPCTCECHNKGEDDG